MPLLIKDLRDFFASIEEVDPYLRLFLPNDEVWVTRGGRRRQAVLRGNISSIRITEGQLYYYVILDEGDVKSFPLATCYYDVFATPEKARKAAENRAFEVCAKDNQTQDEMVKRAKRRAFEGVKWVTGPDGTPMNPGAEKGCLRCKGHGVLEDSSAPHDVPSLMNCDKCWT